MSILSLVSDIREAGKIALNRTEVVGLAIYGRKYKLIYIIHFCIHKIFLFVKVYVTAQESKDDAN